MKVRYVFLAAGALALVAATHEPTVKAQAPTISPAQSFTDNCAACHQEDGKGIEGAFPALAGDTFVKGDPTPAIRTVLNGRGGMPTFKDDLSDDQISAALTHVRTSWGNSETPITPAMVAAQRTGAPPPPADKKPIQAH